MLILNRLHSSRVIFMAKIIIVSLFLLNYSILCTADSFTKEQAVKYRQEALSSQKENNLLEARILLEKAIEIFPNFKEAYNDLGVIYEKFGKLALAENMYLQAVKIDPYYLPPYTNLGYLYEKKGDFAKAAYYWYKRYKLGDKSDIWTQKARKYFLRLAHYPGVGEEVKRMESKILTEELTRQRLKKEKEANDKARQYYRKGVSLYNRGLYKEAREEFENAYSLSPADEDLNAEIIKYLHIVVRLSDKADAKAHIENALNYLQTEDYLAAKYELKRAINLISSIPKD